MHVSFFGYNAFVITIGRVRLLIDPGASLWLPDRFAPLIPDRALEGVTHMLVTHGDPDHHWHTDRVARATGAAVILNREMLRDVDGEMRMLGPRDRGLAFTTTLPRLHPVAVGETIDAAGLSVTGHTGRHGALELRLGPLRLAFRPRPGGRLGHGEMVFEFAVEGRRLVVFGDTVDIPGAWDAIAPPDLALIPIGGAPTMTAAEAAEVAISMGARHVIPCHYDCPALLSRAFNPVDPAPFCARIVAAGLRCHPLRPGESVVLDQGP